MRAALHTLRSSITGVRDIARYVEANSAAALADPAVMRRNSVTIAAATVILSGFLESFLKNVAEAAIDDLCSLNVPFGTLDPDIQDAHYAGGGAVLSAKARNTARASWVTASPADIARRLSSVALGGPYELVWEAFAETAANPKAKVIAEFLKRFGITNPWPSIAQKTRNSHTVLISALNSFMDIRNECAHTGSTGSRLTARDVRGFCVLLNALGKGIVSVLEDQMASMSTAGPTVSLLPALTVLSASPAVAPILSTVSTPPPPQTVYSPPTFPAAGTAIKPLHVHGSSTPKRGLFRRIWDRFWGG